MSLLRSSLVVLSLLLTVVSSQTASASYLIEPHLGYNLVGTGSAGSGSVSTGSTSPSFKYNGVQYGLNIGYQYLGFMGGLAYNRSTLVWKFTTANDLSVLSNFEDEFTRNEWGIFVGYKFPILVKVWGAYYFSNTSEDTDSAHNRNTTVNPDYYPTGTQFKGNTKEIGVGYTGLPFININFSFRNVIHDEVSFPSGSGMNSGTLGSGRVSNNEWVLSLSAPFSVL